MARSAHGVVTRDQLAAVGITRGQIEQRLRIGALLREHRGVYRVGHRAPSVEASYLAAVLACGAGALLYGRASGHLWGLLRGAAPPPEVMAGGRLVDCRWPDHHLTVELDGYRYHRSRHAWEQDRRREREAHARGDDFRRYTYGDVFEKPDLMLSELTALLGAERIRARPELGSA